MDITFLYHKVNPLRPQDTPVEVEIQDIPDDTPLDRVEAVGLTRLRNGFSLDSRTFAEEYTKAEHHGWFIIRTNAGLDMQYPVEELEGRLVESIGHMWSNPE
jgi:hypothetical protein